VSDTVLDQNVILGTAILDVDDSVQLFTDFDFVLDSGTAWSLAHQNVHPALNFSLFNRPLSIRLVNDQSLHSKGVEGNGFGDLLSRSR
jgi:hypothetical protein